MRSATKWQEMPARSAKAGGMQESLQPTSVAGNLGKKNGAPKVSVSVLFLALMSSLTWSDAGSQLSVLEGFASC